ncbi:MAG: hypothetical protein ACQERN_12885 [Thermodesulfobacteriota bacterium]
MEQKSTSYNGETVTTVTQFFYESDRHDNPARMETDIGDDGTIDSNIELMYDQCGADETDGDDADGGGTNGDGADSDGGGDGGCFLATLH